MEDYLSSFEILRENRLSLFEFLREDHLRSKSSKRESWSLFAIPRGGHFEVSWEDILISF